MDDEQDFLRYHPVDELWVTRLTYQDPADGEWYDQEQEVDNLSELVELYNPADILPWLIEASRNPLDHLAPADELAADETPPAESEDDWQNELPAEQRETLAAQRLWQLADAYRSQLQEQQAALLREFVGNAEDALRLTGDLVLLDESDDTLVLRGDGQFETTLNLADMAPGGGRGAGGPPRRPDRDRCPDRGRVLRPGRRPPVGDRVAVRALPRCRLLRRLRLTPRKEAPRSWPAAFPLPANLSAASMEDLFRDAGALREGHFRLKSGRPLAALPREVPRPPVPDPGLGAVPPDGSPGSRTSRRTWWSGPTTGGVLLAFETARHLSAILGWEVRGLFAEPTVLAGGRELRRGFEVSRGDTIVLVDDILTTGASLRETSDAVERAGGAPVAAVVMVDRSTDPVDIGMPIRSVGRIEIPAWEPADCPLCDAG